MEPEGQRELGSRVQRHGSHPKFLEPGSRYDRGTQRTGEIPQLLFLEAPVRPFGVLWPGRLRLTLQDRDRRARVDVCAKRLVSA